MLQTLLREFDARERELCKKEAHLKCVIAERNKFQRTKVELRNQYDSLRNKLAEMERSLNEVTYQRQEATQKAEEELRAKSVQLESLVAERDRAQQSTDELKKQNEELATNVAEAQRAHQEVIQQVGHQEEELRLKDAQMKAVAGERELAVQLCEQLRTRNEAMGNQLVESERLLDESIHRFHTERQRLDEALRSLEQQKEALANQLNHTEWLLARSSHHGDAIRQQFVTLLTRNAEILQCPICLTPYENDPEVLRPTTLACGHTYCVGCVARINGSLCPQCRAPMDHPPTRPLHVDGRRPPSLALREIAVTHSCMMAFASDAGLLPPLLP